MTQSRAFTEVWQELHDRPDFGRRTIVLAHGRDQINGPAQGIVKGSAGAKLYLGSIVTCGLPAAVVVDATILFEGDSGPWWVLALLALSLTVYFGGAGMFVIASWSQWQLATSRMERAAAAGILTVPGVSCGLFSWGAIEAHRSFVPAWPFWLILGLQLVSCATGAWASRGTVGALFQYRSLSSLVRAADSRIEYLGGKKRGRRAPERGSQERRSGTASRATGRGK